MLSLTVAKKNRIKSGDGLIKIMSLDIIISLMIVIARVCCLLFPYVTCPLVGTRPVECLCLGDSVTQELQLWHNGIRTVLGLGFKSRLYGKPEDTKLLTTA